MAHNKEDADNVGDTVTTRKIYYAELKPRRQLTLPSELCKMIGAEIGDLFCAIPIGENHCLLIHQNRKEEERIIHTLTSILKKHLAETQKSL